MSSVLNRQLQLKHGLYCVFFMRCWHFQSIHWFFFFVGVPVMRSWHVQPERWSGDMHDVPFWYIQRFNGNDTVLHMRYRHLQLQRGPAELLILCSW